MSDPADRLRDGVVRRRRAEATAGSRENAPSELAGASVVSEPMGGVHQTAPVAIQEPPAELVDQALLSNFTHQIINPLNGVLGTLHNIIDGTVSDARRPQRLRAAYAQLEVTIELVRNLAYLSQMSTQAGRDSLRKLASDVVLPQTIIESAQFFQEMADSRGMRIVLLNRESQFVVQGHKHLLRQVFLNLFENGIKYGNRDSQITVEMRAQKAKSRLLVEVIGRGEGFDGDEVESLFQIGFRGRNARKTLASGSGLGLYICRQILMLHGAQISAECSAKLGTVTFRLMFPTFRLDAERTANERE